MKNILLAILLLLFAGIFILSQPKVPKIPNFNIPKFDKVDPDRNTKPVSLKVTSFAYYLKNPIIEPIKASLFDLVIMNYETRVGTVNTKFSKEQIASIKSNKKILAYISIGEAESYRDYWTKNNWYRAKPSYIGPENIYWKGNFAIKDLRNEEWKKIVYEQIDAVISQGFDGVLFGGVADDTDKDNLAAFIADASKYAKSRQSRFAVFVQDAEFLADNYAFISTIDGVVKQNLFYSWASNGVTGPNNSPDAIAKSLSFLTKIKDAKRTVLVVEYVSGGQWSETKLQLEKNGFIGYSAPRQLNALRLGQ